MEYSKLVAVSGLSGLYELISSKNDGAIVRSLSDKTTRFAATRIHQFSHLESIEIYTTSANVNLIEIFQAMEKAGGALPEPKDPAAVKSYFEKTYPDLDFDRVYQSDMKKMVKWFEILQAAGVELKISEPEAPVSDPEEPAAESSSPKAEKASQKTATAAADEKDAPAATPEKKAPAKKAAAKKKASPKKKAE